MTNQKEIKSLYVTSEKQVNEDKTQFSLDDIKKSLATRGFGGIDLDYASFLTITQKSCQFSIDGDPAFCDQEFYIKLINSRNKYVLTDAKDKNSDCIHYSYDGKVTTDGENIDDIKAVMVTEDKAPQVKRQLEIFCQLTNRDDKYNNRLVFLSISPTSSSRASGFITELELMGTLKSNPETVIKVSKGAIKSSKVGNYSYFIWAFDIAENLAIANAA